MSTQIRRPHPVVLFFAGWLIPGLAHGLLGKPGKAVLFGVLIIGTFVGGMALSDFDNVYYEDYRWSALAQAPAGIVAYVGTRLRDPDTELAAEQTPQFKVGVLYTSVAGLLNLLVILDAVHLGWQRRGPNRHADLGRSKNRGANG